MCGKITLTADPFGGGIRSDQAKYPFVKVLCLRTAIARFDDRMAAAAVKGAPFSRHERALNAILSRYALHSRFLREFSPKNVGLGFCALPELNF